jgi:hypothetical protein
MTIGPTITKNMDTLAEAIARSYAEVTGGSAPIWLTRRMRHVLGQAAIMVNASDRLDIENILSNYDLQPVKTPEMVSLIREIRESLARSKDEVHGLAREE